ncbi:non-homologous end joining protein Ku [Streptomyces phaeochromogenes]
MLGPALWSGHIVFGLVLVPIRLHAATERGATPLHLVHTTDDCLGRIRYRKVCELDEEEVAEQDMGRGFETPTGIVPISNEDLDNLPIATARAIELVAVVPADRIDPRQIGAASYYLGADRAPAAAKPYVLLREILARTARVVVVKYAVRGDRERLGILRPLHDALALHGLRWSDEIRDVEPGLAPATADVDEDELSAALALIEARSVGRLDEIPDLTDHYAQALDSLIDAKVHDRPLTPQPEPQREALVDLMTALQQSVRDARAARGEPPSGTRT